MLFRSLGNLGDADTCERIRASYGALWDKVAEAQHDCCEFHASGGSRAFSCGGDNGADYVARCEKLGMRFDDA